MLRFRPPPLRALVLPILLLAACTEEDPASPDSIRPGFGLSAEEWRQVSMQVRALADERDITPMPPRQHVRPSLVNLGRVLAFDPILSGNRDISCMTCHVPKLGTGDGRAQSIGQGAQGLGPDRIHPSGAFIPRNAPPLFNLHLQDRLFWDGRVATEGGSFRTPAGEQLTWDMTEVFEFGALSALPLFPVLSREEMRSTAGDNELADLPDHDARAIWAALMRRLGDIPEYRTLFERAYPGTPFGEMTFAHASNAIAGFFVGAFTFDDAPWDRFLRGNDRAVTEEQLAGALKFMNAPCAQCHNGPTFSDDDFHNVALAQFGPGQGNGPSGRDDFGRMNVTGDPADIYKFRSTPLRNVELTAPYGHAGEFNDLARFIDHYSLSADKLRAYRDEDIPEALLRGTLLADNIEQIIAMRDPLILPVAFDSVFTREVTAFMRALTDPHARNIERWVPRRVPSGLPVER